MCRELFLINDIDLYCCSCTDKFGIIYSLVFCLRIWSVCLWCQRFRRQLITSSHCQDMSWLTNNELCDVHGRSCIAIQLILTRWQRIKWHWKLFKGRGKVTCCVACCLSSSNCATDVNSVHSAKNDCSDEGKEDTSLWRRTLIHGIR